MKLFRKIRFIFSADFETKFNKLMAETDAERKSLDNRLSEVVKATLDGEDHWFLELAKRDPECMLNVIKECDTDGNTNK